MNQSEQYDALCELIKDADIQADLDFDEARSFMNEIIRTTPMMHVIICEEAEEKYINDADTADITSALLNPDEMFDLSAIFQTHLTEAVNEQIADCINFTKSMEPDPNEDWQDKLESRIGCAG